MTLRQPLVHRGRQQKPRLAVYLPEVAHPPNRAWYPLPLILPYYVPLPPKSDRLLAALLRQLEGLARQQPVLLIFEDLHWIDPTSREFLDLVFARIDDLPALLVATFRPEFQ